MNRNNRGFTLIELLIVILIIGILAAVAIPVFLGQKDKARIRAINTSAGAIEREFKIIMDHFVQKAPMVFSTSAGQQGCFQHANAKSPNTCALIFPQLAAAGTYQDISDIISLYVLQMNEGLLAISPYDNKPLLTEDDSPVARNGHILITNTSDSSISISAWTDAGSNLVMVSVSSH